MQKKSMEGSELSDSETNLKVSYNNRTENFEVTSYLLVFFFALNDNEMELH